MERMGGMGAGLRAKNIPCPEGGETRLLGVRDSWSKALNGRRNWPGGIQRTGAAGRIILSLAPFI